MVADVVLWDLVATGFLVFVFGWPWSGVEVDVRVALFMTYKV